MIWVICSLFQCFFTFLKATASLNIFFKTQECSGKCSWCYAILFHLYGQLLWVVHSNTKLYARYENIFTVPISVTMHSIHQVIFTSLGKKITSFWSSCFKEYCPGENLDEQFMNVHEQFMHNSSLEFMNSSWTIHEYAWTLNGTICDSWT